MNKVLKRNIKQKFRIVPGIAEIKKSAMRGQAKRYWYTRALQKIKKQYGKHYKIFIGILSATSPRQTVDLNLKMAREVFSLYQFLGKDITREDIAGIVDLNCRVNNTMRALEGKPLSGNKVESFRQNLLGNGDAVTIDTWMIAFAGTRFEKHFLNKSGYLAYSHRIKRVAKILGWNPAEVQASVWSDTYSKINECSIEEVPEFNLN